MAEYKQGEAAKFFIGPLITTAGALATDLTIGTALPVMLKNGATGFATMAGMAGGAASHSNNDGYYIINAASADMDATGPFKVSITNSSALPIIEEHSILSPLAYDAKYSTAVVSFTNLRVDLIDAPNATAISAFAATNLGKMATLATALAALQADTTSIKVSLASVLSETTSLTADSTIIKAGITALQGDTTSIKVSLASVLSETSAIKAETTTIKAGVAALQTDTTSIKVSLASVLSETSGIKAETTVIKAGVAALQTDTTSIKTSLTNLAADTTSIKVSLSSVLSETTSLIADSTVIKAGVAALQADTTSIKTSLTNLAADTTSLKVDSTSIKTSLTNLAADTTSLKADSTAIKASLTTIGGETTAIKVVTDNLPDSGALTTITNYVDCLPASLNDISAADVKTAMEAAGSHLALIKAVTDALTSAAATKLALSAGVIVAGTVSHDNTAATTTVFYSDDVTEATADHFNGRIVIFTSGDLQYQATDITDYARVSGEGKFTVTALTEAPADNVTFIIV